MASQQVSNVRTTSIGTNMVNVALANDAYPQQPNLVDDLAQALGFDRDDRVEAALEFAKGVIPAVPHTRGLLDGEEVEDEPSMPIPSTWRQVGRKKKSAAIAEQLRAASLGFGTGLMVVVPVVMLLTGRLSDLSLAGMRSTPTSPIVQTASISGGPLAQRTVATTHVAVPHAGPAESTGSRLELVGVGRERIIAGDLSGAREILGRAAAADEAEAILALAETFDPNMLAAWGIRDAASDVRVARTLYAKALLKGKERARVRLEALE
jgi:hypothetical protein